MRNDGTVDTSHHRRALPVLASRASSVRSPDTIQISQAITVLAERGDLGRPVVDTVSGSNCPS